MGVRAQGLAIRVEGLLGKGGERGGESAHAVVMCCHRHAVVMCLALGSGH
jgi:hypothetical protein